MVVFLTALIIRLLFSFYFQQFYFGGYEFKYGDGMTYLDPILNLINNGEYIGDKYLADSRYFRPPVYPFFLGIIYIISSLALLDYVVAAIQCVIGSISVILIYYIVLNVSQNKAAALTSASFIAIFPFVILWTPLMYTETVQLFLIFSLLFFATKAKISVYSTIIQGVLIGLIILTKQYLALFLIIPVYIILLTPLLNWRKKIIHILLLYISLFIVVSPWLVRNYISSGNVIVFFGKTSGLRNALDDSVAFTQFANKFDENTTEYMESVAQTGSVKFIKHHKFLIDHEDEITAATSLAYKCGGSFQERRKSTLNTQPPYSNCNNEVVVRFNQLSDDFWHEVAFWDAIETRRDALWKVVSKSDIVNRNLSMSHNNSLTYMLFKYRLFILILGFFGMLYLYFNKIQQAHQKVILQSLFITTLSLYLFFCLILVSAEMRYLLTPDLLIMLFSGIIPGKLLSEYSSVIKFKNIRRLMQL